MADLRVFYDRARRFLLAGLCVDADNLACCRVDAFRALLGVISLSVDPVSRYQLIRHLNLLTVAFLISTKTTADFVPMRPSNQREGLFGAHESAKFAELVQIAKHFKANGLIDSADPHRRESNILDEGRDLIPSVFIIARVKKDCRLRRTVGSRLERGSAESSERFYELCPGG